MREIRALEWRRSDHHIFMQVVGTGFLFRMVRNLVGTLSEVGRGLREPSEVAAILASKDRRRAGVTAPAAGLYLMDVHYPDTPRCELSVEPPLF